MINCFDKEYAFLSNFYDSEIIDEDGICYPTVEHYFQAMKTLDKVARMDIAMTPTPGQAKRKGRMVQLRPDWEDIKVSVMKEALRQKFENPELRARLLATKDEPLEEGNTWHDRFWGKCYCQECCGEGVNMLGQLLMKRRKGLSE